MCVVSMVGDYYKDTLPYRHPGWFDRADQVPPDSGVFPFPVVRPAEVTKAEFDALKKDMEYIKTLLMKAKELDIATGQPDCEMDDKIAFLKKIAEAVGVDLKEVFGK